MRNGSDPSVPKTPVSIAVRHLLRQTIRRGLSGKRGWLASVEEPHGSMQLFTAVIQPSYRWGALSLRVLVIDPQARSWRELFVLHDEIRDLMPTVVSADGRLIAVATPTLRVYDLAGRMVEQLGGEYECGVAPVWSPTAPVMVVRQGETLVLWRPGEHSGVMRLAEDCETAWPIGWSPDGERITFLARIPGREHRWLGNLVVQDVKSGRREQAASDVSWDGEAAWRPRSRLIVWTQEREDQEQTELWVRDLDVAESRSGPRLSGRATRLRWSADGEWLAFRWHPIGRGRRRCHGAPCVVPAASLLRPAAERDAKGLDLYLCHPSVSSGTLFQWNAEGQLMYSRDRRTLELFDPRTGESKSLFALRDGEIVFAERSGRRQAEA